MKELKLLLIVGLTAAAMFYFNPVQDTEVRMKLSILCSNHPELECSEVIDYCEESLQNGHECYIF